MMARFHKTALFGILSFLSALAHSQDVSQVADSQPTITPTVASSTPVDQPITTSLSPAATSIIPTCIERRPETDPAGTDISGALATSDAVNQACGGDGQQTARVGLLSIIYFSTGSLFLNVSHSTLVSVPIEVSAEFCPDHFNAIINSCIVNGNFWGGWWSTANANYTVTNNIYPANGLPGAAPSSTGLAATGTPLPGTSVPGQTETPLPGTTSIPNGTPLPGTDSLTGQTQTQTPLPGTDSLTGQTQTPLPGTSIPLPGTETALPGTTSNPNGTPLPGTTPLPGETQTPLPGTDSIPGQTQTQTPGTSTLLPGSETALPGTSSIPPGQTPLPAATSTILPSEDVIVFATISSQVYSQTYAPFTDSAFLTLATTISTFSVNPQGVTISYEIGPGGIEWQPVTASTGNPGPDLPRPTTLPANPNAPSSIPSGTPSAGLSGTTTKPISSTQPTSSQLPVTTSNPLLSSSAGQATVTHAPSTIPQSGTEALTTITSYNSDVSSVASIVGITANTHVSTGDASHPSAIVPVLWGCWFCPPGAGLVLWGMTFPGIYPPPVPPPFPSFPPITIGRDGNPTPSPSPSDPSPTDQSPSETGTKPNTPSATQSASSGSESSGTASNTASASASSASASASASSSPQPCKRDLTRRDLITSREVYVHRLGKRVEITVPGTDPLKSALSNLGSSAALDSADRLITNRIGDKALDKNGKLIDLGTAHTFVSGLVGELPIPKGQSLNIGGVKFTDKMQWTIRWDYDMTKLTHVNAKFGKSGEATFAYTFSTGNDNPDNPTKNNYAENYMRNAVRSLTQMARLDIAASHDASDPRFIQGTTKEEATQTIVGAWKNIMDGPCPINSSPKDPNTDPNQPS